MDNKLVKEGSLKIYEENTHLWILHKSSETWQKLRNDICLFSQTFPETKSKWEGLLLVDLLGNQFGISLLLKSRKTIRVKHSLLLLNHKNEIIRENHKTGFISHEEGQNNFNIVNTLLNIVLHGQDIITIKVIIQENVSGISKCEACTARASENLKRDFKMILENKEFCDFIIKLNDSSEIPVHKNILAARSPVFAAMFSNDSSEKNEGYVRITDMNKDIMVLFLNFIYTGNINTDLSAENVKPLLIAADKYDLLDLKQFCGKYFENNLKISNAIDTLRLAEFYNVLELKEYVIEFILDNKERFSDPDLFAKMEKKFPNLLTLLMKSFKGKN